MRVEYECELYRDGSGWMVSLPEGFSREKIAVAERDKASQRAIDVLKAEVLRLLLTGKPVPKAVFGIEPRHESGKVMAVAFDADMEGFRVSATEAAEILGVTSARVTQMLKAGELCGYKEGRNSYVTLSSVKARLS